MACPYCENILFAGNGNIELLSEQFNEVLCAGPRIVITPTLGMFRTGHLLAIALEHLPSIACLPDLPLIELYNFLLSFVSEMLKVFGPCCIFEHGVGVQDLRKERGQSIDHAHLHIVPINEQINKFILGQHEWQRSKNICDIKKHSNEGYLLYSFDGQLYICPKAEVESQWIRRVIYDMSDMADKHWDWRKYPGSHEIAETIGLLRNRVLCPGLRSKRLDVCEPIERNEKEAYKVLLIRHGEPDYSPVDENPANPAEKCLIALTDDSVAKIYSLSSDCRFRDASLIVSSPSTRALQTAAILNQTLLLPLKVEFELREWQPDINRDRITLEELIRRREEFIQYKGVAPAHKTVKWESRKSVYDRVYPVIKKYQNLGKIIVVTHSIIISALSGADPDKIPFADISELAL